MILPTRLVNLTRCFELAVVLLLSGTVAFPGAVLHLLLCKVMGLQLLCRDPTVCKRKPLATAGEGAVVGARRF